MNVGFLFVGSNSQKIAFKSNKKAILVSFLIAFLLVFSLLIYFFSNKKPTIEYLNLPKKTT